MNQSESEIRRQQLLLQAKRQYKSDYELPPINPRYSNLFQMNDTKVQTNVHSSSLGMRTILACIIFLGFITASYKGVNYHGWSTDRISSMISMSIDIPTWWKSL